MTRHDRADRAERRRAVHRAETIKADKRNLNHIGDAIPC